MNNIYILNKNYKQIGVLSNQGANPQAPYYDDLYVQELDTGADTYQFSAISSKYTQDLLEIGNHVMFSFNNRNEIFTITSLEYSHYEGYKTIGVYAEGIGFELLEVFMERPPIKKYPNGGNDSDGDGDDNTDDEYADPDDIYIDENGNIIYDKNGSGPPSADDVYIDDDGFIIYKPDKKKEKNDSLEFKNISFPTFLKILLKNTGWKYTCQSGLSSVKHSISVRYDTNIYAVLQDSMQAYRGVELEFVHEMRNGKVQKIVKAYKDGGRGSVVGKRFEYGTNVKGITKTQKVTDSEDDTILYVDNVGVDITYDVDFALKSVEVPEIEIGDTHYVIDKDFYPPMTIKARIGKIEISFTDPTKNKIYLANNKKIRGSSDEEDIRDVLDDYFDDYDDDLEDYLGDHDHDRLVNGDKIVSYTSNGRLIPNTNRQNIGSEEDPWFSLFASNMHTNSIETRFVSIPCDRNDVYDVSEITDSSDVNKQDLLDLVLNKIKVYEYTYYEKFEGSTGYSPILGILSEDFVDHNYSTNKLSDCKSKSSVTNLIMYRYHPSGNTSIHDAHRYELSALVAALIGAFQQYVEDGGVVKNDAIVFSNGTRIVPASDGGINGINVEREDGNSTKLSVYGELYATEKIKCLEMEANTLNIKTIQFSDGTTLTSANGSGGDPGDGGLGIPEGVITYTEDPIPGNGYRLDFNADRTYVNDLLIANDGMNVIGDLNVQGNILLNGKPIAGDGSGSDPSNPGGGDIEIPSDVFEVIDGKLHIKLPINFENSAYFINCGVTGGLANLTGVMKLGAEILEGCRIIKASEGELRIEGDLVVTGNIISSGSSSGSGSDTISCKEIILRNNGGDGDPNTTTSIKFIQNENHSQILGDRWVDFSDTVYIRDNLVIDGELLGATALTGIQSIGVREIIGVNSITFSDGSELTSAGGVAAMSINTQEYYEEELRIRDEKIASLEARLAKIEEMLGINNN